MARPICGLTRNEAILAEKSAKEARNAKDPIEKLRLLCLQRGVSGIIGFGKMFRRMDDDKSGSLSKNEFIKGMIETGIKLDSEHMNQLFKLFDRDNSGQISYEELLRAIRPPLSQTRKNLIEQAFKKIDKTGDQIITIDDIRLIYNVNSNAAYLNGQKTKEELFKLYINRFEENGSVDGILTKDEFFDYYAGVSASIDEDVYFDLMMRQAWNL